MSQLRLFPLTSGARRLVFASLTALAACDRATSAGSADSLLQRDLALASEESRAPTPVFSDTAVSEPRIIAPPQVTTRTTPSTMPRTTPRATPPARPAVTPRAPEARARAAAPPVQNSTNSPVPANTAEVPQPSGRASRSLGAGGILVGRTGSELCSLANRPGDRLVATLSGDVAVSDGTLLRAGTPILVQLAVPGPSGEFNFIVKAIQVDGELHPIDGRVQVDGPTTERKISKGGDKGKVVGGAIAGAILGRVLGGGAKGTIIGAAGGAAAGTVAASRNTVTETCLAAGAKLTVTLLAPLVLIPGAP